MFPGEPKPEQPYEPEKRKGSLLPIVDPEIGETIKRELLNQPGLEYIEQHLKRIQKENPTVANFINLMAQQSKDPKMVTTACVLVYRLLETQAEIDELKKLG
jgi:hypothetical protein